jgi:transposase-like protein
MSKFDEQEQVTWGQVKNALRRTDEFSRALARAARVCTSYLRIVVLCPKCGEQAVSEVRFKQNDPAVTEYRLVGYVCTKCKHRFKLKERSER